LLNVEDRHSYKNRLQWDFVRVRIDHISLKIMVGARGFEPPTPCAQGGWKEVTKAACFQVLAIKGVVAELLKVVEPC
jgi:hypothetical protein